METSTTIALLRLVTPDVQAVAQAISTLTDDCKPDLDAAFTSAALGDARDLARVLEECVISDIRALLFILAVAPRVRVGNDRLARVAWNLSHGWLQTKRRAPLEVVHYLAMQRDVAAALGQTARAAELQAIIDRHLTAFATSEQLLIFAWWRALRTVP